MVSSDRRIDDRYFGALVQALQDAVLCTDLQGEIVFINRTALNMWGYEEADVLGKPFRFMFVQEDRDRCCERLIRETHDHGAYKGEFLFQRKDGTRFPGYLESNLMDGSENRQHIVFVIHDFTEQKKLQQELLDSQKLAFLGKLVEGVSHEIRNPIVTLGGYARRLKRILDPDHPGQKCLRIILKDVERMELMLKDIEGYLQFAHAQPPPFSKVDLQDVIGSVITALHLPDNIHLDQDFPSEGPTIFGNRNHLRELFHHLVENAVEAMPEGGSLSLQLKRDDHKAQARIQDTGIGIPQNVLSNIFSPFFTTKTKGAGVGLARAYIIVEEHSGQIQVDSELQKGTTFTLSFPVDRRQRLRQE